ncbi:MAG TPA: YfhO family protein [Ramlibacter sp.]|nr:YfhO family protein [Ramlibacter sp.]
MEGERSGTSGAPRMLAILLALQALLAFLVLGDFIRGTRYFAYLDIGSDTYEIFTSHAMHMAQLLAREGWTGWSFNIGLGAPATFMLADLFRALTAVAGPEHVLPMRIWVYLLKLVLGGCFFYLLARRLVQRAEAALLMALLYSFCGYIVINGVWDPEAIPFVFFPLVLWALLRLVREGKWVAYPLAVAATLLCGYVFLTFGVSLLVAFAAVLAISEDRKATLRLLATRVVPLTALGFVMAAPVVLPLALQLLDSPRVAGAESVLSRVLAEARRPSDWTMWVLQLGGLFHKDLYGSASFHRGFMNYLEGPGFWVGMLPLLLLPQLWRGPRDDRRLLVAGVAGILLYMAVPAIRFSAFGFASPYFRSTTLWVTLALLLLGARALDRVLREGVDLRLLAVGVLWVGGTFGALAAAFWAYMWEPHAFKIMLFIAAWSVLLLLVALRRLGTERFLMLALGLACVEIVAVAWPSYLAARPTVSATEQPFNDVTVPALAAIRKADAGVFRVEKTFDSVSEAEAMAQGYMGVKSYHYHGSAVIDLHRNLDMMRKFRSLPVNYTNWIVSPGERYVVHSALGVKYMISRKELNWPGFEPFASGPGWHVYRNELALPLGVVHTRQVTRDEMAALSRLPADRHQWFRDLALVNAVVLDQPMPKYGTRWELPELAARGVIDLPLMYAQPARELQRTGLQVTHFSSDEVVGTVQPAQAGILVFSIPFYQGWSLTVDGQPAPLFKANFGMLATPIAAGRHEVALRYRMPGLRTGLLVGLGGLLVLGLLISRARG